MSWLDGLRHRAASLLRPHSAQRDMEEEMAFHLELDAMQQGDAHAARRRFGNRTYLVEERRDASWLALFDGVARDTRYAWRSIRRAPGLALAVVVTLALGIGVNSAVFATLDTLFVRPPAGVPHPASLRRVWVKQIQSDDAVSTLQQRAFWISQMNWSMSRAVARAAGDSDGVAVYTVDNAGVHGEKTYVSWSTANYFRIVGVGASLGRVYNADEDRFDTGGSRVVVVSDRYWRTRLGADRGALGRQVKIGGQQYTVIGVMPAGFNGVDVQQVDAWIPFSAQPVPGWIPTKRWWEFPWNYSFQPLMRIPASFDEAAFDARATTELRRLARAQPHPGTDTLTEARSGSLLIARGLGTPRQEETISTRLGAVALLVLLIACANVLNLLLARAVQRRREVAVRLALGVSRARLMRLVMSEVLLLALLASAASLVIAWAAGTTLRALLLPDVTWYTSVLDWRVVAFTLAVGIACGVVAGVIPALQSSNPRLNVALKDGAMHMAEAPTGRAPRRAGIRSGLVVVQAALSVTLLVGAVLFIRSLRNVMTIDIGYDREALVVGTVEFDNDDEWLDTSKTPAISRVADELSHRPEFASVARADMQPMSGFRFNTLLTSTDSVSGNGNDSPTFSVVTPNFFETVGLRMLRGTTLDAHTPSVVLNDTMAKRLWPRKQALGECLYFKSRNSACLRVTGIVENGHRVDILEDRPLPLYYLALGAADTRDVAGNTIIARATPGSVASAEAAMRDALTRNLPGGYPRVQTLSDQLDRQYRPWRLGAQLFGAFSVLALLVALVGVYSTVSYGVSRRTHEFGVRVALGARPGDVIRLVLKREILVTACGIALGLGLVRLAGPLVATLLYHIEPNDAATLTVVAIALLCTATLAALLPAWRAARVDPSTALRAE